MSDLMSAGIESAGLIRFLFNTRLGSSSDDMFKGFAWLYYVWLRVDFPNQVTVPSNRIYNRPNLNFVLLLASVQILLSN